MGRPIGLTSGKPLAESPTDLEVRVTENTDMSQFAEGKQAA